ncbi:hypothetical protein FT663_02942 [Candidozyma haemuli var. vulneris]|uniref:Uncharacterized protein n=1 Tax=Candidozyma haemuli TaxID=45357 RepID=A0A2V1AWU0_9ASCO|nr:hypothetical protein CXQ85_005356 [[Candida] haemuloni]KAF3987317.1 hypothetical protein FT662_04048 [[Candida] haemuloni var. vulneris]KAF3990976.1 hypothetical protein FT663_02942 [[Candida] haemuloni var. vulneris]PVH22328.1 hypothetical protein CXQ85_005356 [[Candida] haemuloni]
MQFSTVLLASIAASAVSALKYVTVTNDGATYVETITEPEDLTTPEGAFITYKVITGTKGTNTYTKTIWSTGYYSSAEAEATSTAEAEDVESSAEATTEEAKTSEAQETEAPAAESSAEAPHAEVSSYEGAAGNLGVAAGVAGFAGVAALLI